MKYTIKNIRNFIREEKMIFFLICLSIFCSVLILDVSYGIYNEINRDILDSTYGIQELVITFTGSPSEPVKKGELDQVFESMNQKFLEGLDSVAVSGYFPQDEKRPENLFTFNIRFNNGKITYVEEIYDNLLIANLWEGGRYFSQEEYEAGEYVVLEAFVEDTIDQESYKYKKENEYIEINGKNYRCIGQQSATYTPWIPYTTLEQDFVIEDVAFCTYEIITKAEYLEIVSGLESILGDRAQIPEYPIPDADTTMIYKSILAVCVLIAVISALVYMVLYQYIVDKRKRTLDIFRISGLSLREAQKIYIRESMLLLAACYGTAQAVFHFVCLPNLQRIYSYMDETFSLESYLKLGILYFVVLYGIVKFEVTRILHKSRMIERV